jgi:hypothetical protein
MSPDGKWVWDGSQWQPAVGVEPAHEAVFAAWKTIQVDAASPAEELVQPPGEMQMESPSPVVDYSYAAPEYSSSEPIVPLWQQTKGGGISKYLYPVAGLAVLVMAMLVLNSMSFISLPWMGAGASRSIQAARPSPTPDISGSDAVRADRLLNNLKPPLSALDEAIPAIGLHCVTLSTDCSDALTTSNEQVSKVMAVFANADIAPCIAAAMTRMRTDTKGMGDQLQLALKAFPDNNKSELSGGINHFKTYRQAAAADMNAALLAEKKCLTVEVPSWVPR